MNFQKSFTGGCVKRVFLGYEFLKVFHRRKKLQVDRFIIQINGVI